MKRALVIALIMCATGIFNNVFGWGRTGHDAVSYIAECHLTPTAKSNIGRYLGGESIVYDSSWLDLVRDTPEYRHTSRCHMFTVDPDGRYKPDSRGDAVTLLNQQIELLRDYKSMTDSAVNVAIKIIVHLVGDLHCPSHADFEGVDQWFEFDLNGKSVGFHRFWDYYAIETSHKWQFLEYGNQLDRCAPDRIAEISRGTPEDWATETALTVAPAYTWIQPDAHFDKPATNRLLLQATRLADRQIVKAAYRLSHLLNTLFDP